MAVGKTEKHELEKLVCFTCPCVLCMCVWGGGRVDVGVCGECKRESVCLCVCA